ncbi:MAG: WYL domain-containing protein [Streptosporangiaceae bacterium]
MSVHWNRTRAGKSLWVSWPKNSPAPSLNVPVTGRNSVPVRLLAQYSDYSPVPGSHGLVLKAGTWYVVARCGGAMRTYRVGQILARYDRRSVTACRAACPAPACLTLHSTRSHRFRPSGSATAGRGRDAAPAGACAASTLPQQESALRAGPLQPGRE